MQIDVIIPISLKINSSPVIIATVPLEMLQRIYLKHKDQP
jgi:hypothetical protein